VGGDQQITVLSSHASRWTFGLPLCGNGSLNAGEACDQPGVQAQCGGGQVCKSDCQCTATCDCCALNAGTYEFTTRAPRRRLWHEETDVNGMATNLACNGINFGGGGTRFPCRYSCPISASSYMSIASCDSATERLTLAGAPPRSPAASGTCTTAGCGFGPRSRFPTRTALRPARCIMLTVAQDASGTGSCEGDTTIALPLIADIYLTGDSAHDPGASIGGIQSCPLCSSGTCVGGPNNGMA
jgi:hypothetical protein